VSVYTSSCVSVNSACTAVHAIHWTLALLVVTQDWRQEVRESKHLRECVHQQLCVGKQRVHCCACHPLDLGVAGGHAGLEAGGQGVQAPA